MSSTVSQIEGIKTKLSSLMEHYVLLQEENLELRKERNRYKDMIAEKEKIIKSLDKNINTLKIAKSIENDDQSELKQTINKYIKEIDKCIAQLNS